MSVVINELEVVPAEPVTAQPPPGAAAAATAAEAPSPDAVARQVERLLRHRQARAERLRAY